MELWQWIVYAVVALGMATLSGIAGAGGGFVLTPLLILLGLSPAQAVSTGKLTGLAVTIGALGGLQSGQQRVSKRRVIPVMLLAVAVGLVVPFVIRGLESGTYRILLGVILLLMIPIMILKKVGIKPHKPALWQKYVGSGLLTVALFLQGAFSGGLGTLVNVVLMGMLGMTAQEANITKRWSQLIMNIVIVTGVFLSGLIVWPLLVVGVPMTFIGGYIGGRLSVKRSNQFVMNVMIALMVVSALALIFGA